MAILFIPLWINLIISSQKVLVIKLLMINNFVLFELSLQKHIKTMKIFSIIINFTVIGYKIIGFFKKIFKKDKKQ